nr:hypothetical protein [Burkholderia anthina]
MTEAARICCNLAIADPRTRSDNRLEASLRCAGRRLAIVHAVDMRVPHTGHRLASHSNPEGEVSMSTHIRSQEARAAQRFVEATRNVDQAFRVVRGESDDDISSAEYARAMSRLDRALDELAQAQEFFDRVVSADAASGN